MAGALAEKRRKARSHVVKMSAAAAGVSMLCNNHHVEMSKSLKTHLIEIMTAELKI
jgi:hypothetical protein